MPTSSVNPRVRRGPSPVRLDLRCTYVAPDVHERACRAVHAATRNIRAVPAGIRNARALSQQPNVVERLMRLIDQLAALGAPRADLRAIPLELTAYIEHRGARTPLPVLMQDAQARENAGNLAEVAVLQDARDAMALRRLAEADRADACLKLERAAVADAEANRLQEEG